ncbi:MAG: hypothetical protein Q7U54_12615 [Bacteroidales bacterium]|nr:hypothetical protein [Bacteroidales bacterium]
MENLIYILIGIAWVAYSLYSARQKAIQKQQSSGLPPSGPSPSSPLPIPGNQGGGKSLLEEILREIAGEPKLVPQPVVQPVVPVKQTTHRTVSELNKTYDDHSGYKFITSPSVESSGTDVGNKWKAQEVRAHLTNEQALSTKFDLREAIIYSELLNRKYF